MLLQGDKSEKKNHFPLLREISLVQAIFSTAWLRRTPPWCFPVNFMILFRFFVLLVTTQSAFTCSKLTIEILEIRYEICSKLTIKTPERRHWEINFDWEPRYYSITLKNILRNKSYRELKKKLTKWINWVSCKSWNKKALCLGKNKNGL